MVRCDRPVSTIGRHALRALLPLALLGNLAAAQTVKVSGVVTDSASGARLEGARVSLLHDGQTVGTAESDGRGRFRLLRVAPGSYEIQISRIGYAPRAGTPLDVGATDLTLAVQLPEQPLQLEPVVVTANLALETVLRSPSAVTVVPRSTLETTVAPTLADHLRDVPGIDFASKGFFSQTFSTRGPRNVTASDLLVLSDYRYTALPVLEFNNAGLIPATTDDLDRIEVVRGPGAVIYGPNSRRGVVHYISRSPLGEPETHVTFTGGQRAYADGSFRISRRVGSRFGVKLSGRYARADEWHYTDPVEASLRAQALAAGALADTLLIGRRRPTADVLQSEARADWIVAPGATLVTSAGVSRGVGIETGAEAGAAQSNGWRSTFVQTRLEHPHLFANVMLDLSDAGDVYNLRSGARLKENSRRFAAQLQYRTERGPLRLLAGSDFRWGIPRTNGILNGRFENDDDLRETGAYLHASVAAGPRVELSGALRLDHHNRLADEFFLSPRAAVVFKPAANHALRASWGRSFAQPSARALFPDLDLGPLGPLPFDLRLEGSAGRGFSFDRSCGGLCMRIPAAFAGGQVVSVPADATLAWPAMVALLQSQGVDLSGVPAPTGAQVASNLALLNPALQTFTPVTPAQVVDVAPVQRTVESSFEAGYKGYLTDRLFATVDWYYTRASHVFATTSTVNTPNVFFDPVTLSQYLGQYMSAPQAQAVASTVATIPVGTIEPRQVPGADLLIFQPPTQGGRYEFWGADFTLGWRATSQVTVTGGYSFASKDSTDLGGSAGYLLFQAPRHKGNLGIGWRDQPGGHWAYLRGRGAGGFSVSSPAYVGRVDGFAVFDVGAGIRLPWALETWLSLDALNVLDHRHAEFVGTPEIGRLISSRVQVSF
jgi:outer membrane receptor for ferrienterochelin and colicins